MTERIPETDLPAWRAVVQKEAREWTIIEAKLRWGLSGMSFNYRWEHIQVVVKLAVRLAELTGADKEVVEAAAWLHDCRKEGPDDDHGVAGAQVARTVLAQTDFPASKIELVAEAIARHEGMFLEKPMELLEAAILWDADKLSKLGRTYVLQYIGYWIGIRKGTMEQLLEHFQSLGWLRHTVESFNTAPARAAARRRWADQQLFLESLMQELDGEDLV